LGSEKGNAPPLARNQVSTSGQPAFKLECPLCADCVEKVLFGQRLKILRTARSSHARRFEGPHRLTQKPPPTLDDLVSLCRVRFCDTPEGHGDWISHGSPIRATGIERAGWRRSAGRLREDEPSLPFRGEKEELEITKRPPSSGPAHFEHGSTGSAGIHIDLHSNRHFDDLRRSPFHVFTSCS
jgi:hypothetical protein